MLGILESQKTRSQYISSLNLLKKITKIFLTAHDKPTFSHTLFKDYIAPELRIEQGVLWVI